MLTEIANNNNDRNDNCEYFMFSKCKNINIYEHLIFAKKLFQLKLSSNRKPQVYKYKFNPSSIAIQWKVFQCITIHLFPKT